MVSRVKCTKSMAFCRWTVRYAGVTQQVSHLLMIKAHTIQVRSVYNVIVDGKDRPDLQPRPLRNQPHTPQNRPHLSVAHTNLSTTPSKSTHTRSIIFLFSSLCRIQEPSLWDQYLSRNRLTSPAYLHHITPNPTSAGKRNAEHSSKKT